MAEALQSAGLLDDPSESTDENGMVDLSLESPDGMAADGIFWMGKA